MGEGQQALQGPRSPRHNVRVQLPCQDCLHSGMCIIEQQIEENLVLEIIEIGRPVEIKLDCSEFIHASFRRRQRPGWSPARRAKFAATLAGKKKL